MANTSDQDPEMDSDDSVSKTKSIDVQLPISESDKKDNENQVENNSPGCGVGSGSSFSGWFSSFVQTAKQTVSKTTMESIKRDLTELKDVVQHDTTNIVYSTASLVKNTFNEIGNSVSEIGSLGTNVDDDEQSVNEPPNDKLVDKIRKKDSKDKNDIESHVSDISGDGQSSSAAISNEQTTKNQQESSTTLPFDLKTINSWTNKFTDTAKTTMSLVKDTLVDSIFANFSVEELDDEPHVIHNGQMIMIDNWKQLLHHLQIDPNTYCREPSGLLEDYDNWLVKFNLINYQKQTEYLIENIPEIRKYHDELVPKTLSENDFWHRYFYKVHQLKEEQAHLILNKINIEQSKTKTENVISQSSTEEWEKVSNELNSSDRNSQKEADSKCSSDDDREWVKAD